ncbi:MAG TPA: FHA domain-containing protein [Thermoanaerobaculia bacterium]|nr:FHA domain-containing protein [Thermoanaerobaculia bacterium]
MIIECTNCRSRYQYDENRFGEKLSKRIKCARCQQIFEIFNPAQAGGEARPAGPPSHEIGDRTGIRRDERPRTVEEPLPDMPPPAPAASQTAPLQLPPGKRLSLAVIDGPDAGSVFRLEKPRVTIGRQGADLTLNDSDASRHHAAVEVRDTAYTLWDLQSTNGVVMEGQKIDGSAELQNHSEFQVGSSTLMLIVTEEI